MSDARRVLIAWIVGAQMLVFPCLVFGAVAAMMGLRFGTGSRISMLAILMLSLLVEGAVAFGCGVALRERLRDRLSYSPFVVSLASSVGVFAALLGALVVARSWLASGQLAAPIFLVLAACGLGLGSGLGALVGCRYRPDNGSLR